MTKKIIIEVGQTFSISDYDNDLVSKVKCVEDENETYPCKSCVFNKTDTCDSMECNGCLRPDDIDVHFEYVGL